MAFSRSIVLCAVLAVVMAAGVDATPKGQQFSRALRCIWRSCGDYCDDCRCGTCYGCSGGWYLEGGWCKQDSCKPCCDYCNDCGCDGKCRGCSGGYWLRDPWYCAKSTAEADASADAFGPGASTYTNTNTFAAPGRASSDSHSSATSG